MKPTSVLRAIACGWLAIGAAPLAGPVAGATRTDLDRGWQFRADPDEFGDSFAWQSAMPADTDAIRLPNTWNVGRLHDYLGVGWYFVNFDAPAGDAMTQVQLHFGATFYQARVWLNGVELGAHEGGFTAYAFDVTRQLRAKNYLAVRIDNRPGIATIPGYGARGAPQAWYDWWTYGGIVRDVWLTSSGPVWVGRQSIREQKIGADWQVHDRVALHSALPSAAVLRLRARIVDADDRVVASVSQSLALEPGDHERSLDIKLVNPQLWRIDRPSLYRMVVEIGRDGAAPLDVHSDTFGVRSVEIRNRHLLLNGERVRLTGLARHEDSPAEGLAETPATMQRDYDDLKALNTTLSRPVHYPQNPYILDYADRHGILLIPEIPVWQFSEAQLSDPRVLALAQRQMREMIEEAGNHPSIFAWSVANESAMGTSGGIRYFRSMRDLIRQIDPGRYVSFADDNLAKLERADQSAASDADFLLMNQYFGTWHGPANALEPALDRVNSLFPEKMVIISEFGYPGMFAKQASEADPDRIHTIETQLPILASRDWIAGAILWCYQDYKSRRNLAPGLVEGFVDHGVVDEQRRRKPSYAVWRTMNAPAAIDAQWSGGSRPNGFTIVETPNSERSLPSYPLHDYRIAWRVLDEAGIAIASGSRALADGQGAERVTGTLPAQASSGGLTLVVSLLRGDGTVAAERTVVWPAVPEPGSR